MRSSTARVPRNMLVVTFAVAMTIVAAATAAYALLGGTVPTQKGAITYTVPKVHVSDSGPLNVLLGTYPHGAFSELAILTGSLAPRSLTGEEHVQCELTIGSRIVGSFDQADIGGILPSTGYGTTSIAITGTYVAHSGESLRLLCNTSGVSDALLLDTHVVVLNNLVHGQVGGA